MATSANNHSPKNPGDGPAVNSPQAKQSAGGRGALSPWMQVVRGSESESIVDVAPSSPLSPAKASASSTAFSADDSTPDAQMEGADNGSGINNAGKKPVWNKPSNGVAEAGAVMGALSWPALSESARASPKSSPSDPLKVVTDGLVSVSQGTGIASPVSQKKTISNNANVSLTSNHGSTTRQKSMKRGGGGGGGSSSGGGLQSPQPTLDQSGVEVSHSVGKSNSAVVEPSSHSKETTHKESGQKGSGLVSQSSSGGNSDHHQQPQRNVFRRGNAGSHPRGDGSYHHNHGGRRDHNGNNHDWNPHRSFNGRDMQMQSPRGVPRGFMRNPPPPNSAFVPPPPPPLHVRPYGGPVVYSEVPPPVIYVPAPPPDSLRGVPLVASPLSPHPMFYLTDPQLHARIVGQIDYYFSNENLVKDTFLRMNMDDQGWVPIRLIAGFKKVMMLTDNIQFILDALHSSTIVEIQGERVRRRNDWSKWIMRPSSSPSSSSSSSVQISSPQSGGPDMIFMANMQNLVLDEYNTTTGSRMSSANEEGGAAAFSSKK